MGVVDIMMQRGWAFADVLVSCEGAVGSGLCNAFFSIVSDTEDFYRAVNVLGIDVKSVSSFYKNTDGLNVLVSVKARHRGYAPNILRSIMLAPGPGHVFIPVPPDSISFSQVVDDTSIFNIVSTRLVLPALAREYVGEAIRAYISMVETGSPALPYRMLGSESLWGVKSISYFADRLYIVTTERRVSIEEDSFSLWILTFNGTFYLGLAGGRIAMATVGIATGRETKTRCIHQWFEPEAGDPSKSIHAILCYDDEKAHEFVRARRRAARSFLDQTLPAYPPRIPRGL